MVVPGRSVDTLAGVLDVLTDFYSCCGAVVISGGCSMGCGCGDGGGWGDGRDVIMSVRWLLW